MKNMTFEQDILPIQPIDTLVVELLELSKTGHKCVNYVWTITDAINETYKPESNLDLVRFYLLFSMISTNKDAF